MSKFNELKVYSRLSWMAYGDEESIMPEYKVIAVSPKISLSGFQAIIYQKGTEKVLAIRGKKLNLKNLI